MGTWTTRALILELAVVSFFRSSHASLSGVRYVNLTAAVTGTPGAGRLDLAEIYVWGACGRRAGLAVNCVFLCAASAAATPLQLANSCSAPTPLQLTASTLRTTRPSLRPSLTPRTHRKAAPTAPRSMQSMETRAHTLKPSAATSASTWVPRTRLQACLCSAATGAIGATISIIETTTRRCHSPLPPAHSSASRLCPRRAHSMRTSSARVCMPARRARQRRSHSSRCRRTCPRRRQALPPPRRPARRRRRSRVRRRRRPFRRPRRRRRARRRRSTRQSGTSRPCSRAVTRRAPR